MTNRILVACALLALPIAAAAQNPAKPVPKPAATPVAAPAPAPSNVPAAQLALVTGSVTVSTPEGARALGAGDSVFEGQTLVVGPNSYANLKFADGGRVLLRPNTEFAIESYRYAAAAPAAAPAPTAPKAAASAEGTAFFRLVRGGFRAITGLIGKADRQSYRVTTPAATIGIRGTDYEVQTCAGDCPSQAQALAGGTEVASTTLAGLELAQAGGSSGGGIIVATHAGSIALKTTRGEFVVDMGQVALALTNGQTFMLPVIPDVMLLDSSTRPDACE